MDIRVEQIKAIISEIAWIGDRMQEINFFQIASAMLWRQPILAQTNYI